MCIVEHGNQGVVVALNAGRDGAVLDGIKEGFGQVGVSLHPAHGLGLAQVEMEPQELSTRCNGATGPRCQPLGRLHRIDLSWRGIGAQHIAANQPCGVAAVVGRVDVAVGQAGDGKRSGGGRWHGCEGGRSM
ncbi:hypothetical protein D3C71_1546660 [compost metagenome]